MTHFKYGKTTMRLSLLMNHFYKSINLEQNFNFHKLCLVCKTHKSSLSISNIVLLETIHMKSGIWLLDYQHNTITADVLSVHSGLEHKTI